MAVFIPIEIKKNNKSLTDTLDEIQNAVWVLNCAMTAIEEVYAPESVRYKEMKDIETNGLNHLKNVLIEINPSLHQIHFYNFNHLWNKDENLDKLFT